MLRHHMPLICKRPRERAENVALKRWAPFIVE
jgi:hypothetical protein